MRPDRARLSGKGGASMNLHHPTTHKRPAFKVPPLPPAAATNGTATTDNTGAFVTIPTSEYVTSQHKIEDLQRKLEDLETIILNPHESWSPKHRVIVAAMYLTNDNKPLPHTDKYLLSSFVPKSIEQTLHISEGAALTALQQLNDANVLTYKAAAIPKNRHGEPIPAEAVDKTRGDKWQRESETIIPVRPIIKPLSANPTQEKDRMLKQQKRSELKHLQAKLAALECPECGITGHLHIVCGICGCRLDADPKITEDDLLIINQAAPNISESEISTPATTNDIAETIAAATNDIQPYTDDEREQLQSQWDKARQRNIEAVQRWMISESEIDTPATIAPTDETPCEQYAIGPAAADELRNESPATPPTIEAAAAPHISDSDFINKYVSDSEIGTEKGVNLTATPPPTTEPEVNPPAANISPAQLTQLLGNEARYIAAKYHSKWRAERGNATQLDAATALLKLEDTHNIVLSGSGYAVIDIDAGIDELLNAYPQLSNAPAIYRVNAPNRGKLIIKCGDAITIAKHHNEAKTHEIEVKREAVVMGIHETGVQILCKHNGQPIPVLAMAEVETLIRSFAPIAIKPKQQAAKLTPLSVPINKPNTQTEGDVRAAISWWNEQPANIAEVERLIASCPTKGKAFAIRDEKTPSTVYRPAQEGHTTATWRDFGAGISRDAFDMYILLTGRDKRRFIGEVMREWRAANTRPTVTTATPKPTPAPATINIVAVWLQRLADIAEDVIAGNPCWIPKRELSADDAATIAARLPAGMQWIADNPLSYIVRAA